MLHDRHASRISDPSQTSTEGLCNSQIEFSRVLARLLAIAWMARPNTPKTPVVVAESQE
jgi:hypothetical protein